MRLSACRYASVRAAYVTGLGWAAPGKDWLAVAVGLKPKVVVAPGSGVYGPVGSPVTTYVFGANTKPTATNAHRGATPILFTAIPTGANLTLTAGIRYTAKQEDWAAKANHSPKSIAIAATWILPVA
ncbi:hypothetical protein PWY87_31675 [Kribbella solani]|uniref:hypothetical protein n=2 Tax=Kribbella solani TaxID=236067 RepID=UPI0029B2118F|nr:hypothetical protein [Kribbella solani]MDX3006279.1 hypothetical protein [Kribbella solani]